MTAVTSRTSSFIMTMMSSLKQLSILPTLLKMIQMILMMALILSPHLLIVLVLVLVMEKLQTANILCPHSHLQCNAFLKVFMIQNGMVDEIVRYGEYKCFLLLTEYEARCG